MRVDREYFERMYGKENADVVVKLLTIMSQHQYGAIYTLAKRFRARVGVNGSRLGKAFYDDPRKAIEDTIRIFNEKFPGEDIHNYKMRRNTKDLIDPENIEWVHK